MATMLSGQAGIAGVIGWPVAHSLSPRLHNYWLVEHGIDGAYIPLPVRPEDLESVIRALPKMGFRGVNLTLPHKELVMPMLDIADEEARLIGAANTLIIDGKAGLFGMNSDGYGFIENIRPQLPMKKNKAVILGAGGAAKAVCYALLKEGFASLIVANRTPGRAEALAGQFPGRITAVAWEKRAAALDGAALLVNATSLGMQGKPPLEIDLTALSKAALVTDIVYTPRITPLLAAAAARGNPVADGLGMLIHQAVPGFEAWFGIRPQDSAGLRKHLQA